VTIVEGLAPPCESISRSERASEAGSRRQSREIGGGLPPRERKGSTCRWKAPRIGEAARVDARAVETVLALSGRLSTGERGARQGASEAGSPALCAAENAVAGKRRSRAVLVSSSINEWRDAGGLSEAGDAPSSAALPGAGLPQGGPTPLSGWLGAHALGASRRWSPRRKLWARESSDFRVLVSNVGCRGR